MHGHFVLEAAFPPGFDDLLGPPTLGYFTRPWCAAARTWNGLAKATLIESTATNWRTACPKSSMNCPECSRLNQEVDRAWNTYAVARSLSQSCFDIADPRKYREMCAKKSDALIDLQIATQLLDKHMQRQHHILAA
jgi:hypothetical protein